MSVSVTVWGAGLSYPRVYGNRALFVRRIIIFAVRGFNAIIRNKLKLCVPRAMTPRDEISALHSECAFDFVGRIGETKTHTHRHLLIGC